jgi:hypothetical protein
MHRQALFAAHLAAIAWSAAQTAKTPADKSTRLLAAEKYLWYVLATS